MDLQRALNFLLVAAAVVRLCCQDGVRAGIEDLMASLLCLGSRPAQGDVAEPPQRDRGRGLALAMARGNASVWAALLADAAAVASQHRYLAEGFAAPAEALDRDGNALRDLAAALQLAPAGAAAPEDGEAALPEAEAEDWERSERRAGLGTNYGDVAAVALAWLLPGEGRLGETGFEPFQAAWHAWQLEGGARRHRGRATEIALKNLDRGLRGRDAAALAGDIGAAPRLPGLVAVFVADARRQGEPLERTEDRLAAAARDLTMATHDRAEALAAAEFLARVTFRLIFREHFLPPTPEWARHPVDRPTAPSLVWRAIDAVQRRMAMPFIRRVVRDAEELCRRQQRRAPLGGELGGTRKLDPAGDLDDLGRHHTRRLPTPQSDTQQRRLFGLSGGISAVLPAALYLSWKYERHLGAALTANALLGGNAAGRGVVLGLLAGARAGAAGVPQAWLAQLQVAPDVRRALSALDVARPLPPPLRHSPCPASLCEVGDWRSAVTTSADVRIEAVAVVPGDAPAGEERRLTVRLNVSNLGVTGLPICPHGALWLLWEVGGTAKGRFREVGSLDDVPERCVLPRQSATLSVDISSLEPAALRGGPQELVGLLEILRPAPAAPQSWQPGAGNLVRARLLPGGPVKDCEHFAAKIGRLRVPLPLAV